MVCVSERDTIKTIRRTACLRRPTASSIRRSDDRPILTDSGASVHISERDAKKESCRG
jgi:hypothetical protein